MAKISDLRIVFDIEPVVKLVCCNFDCMYNLRWADSASCNLKNIRLDFEGHCMDRFCKSKANSAATCSVSTATNVDTAKVTLT